MGSDLTMLEAELRRTYELVGEATTVWNQAEEIWSLIFDALMYEADVFKRRAIYGWIQTGAQQRQLTMTLVPIALRFDVEGLKKREPIERDRRWLQRQIGRLNAITNILAGRRNAVIHSMIGPSEFEWPPVVVARDGHRPSRLSGKDIEAELVSLILDTSDLIIRLLDARNGIVNAIDPGTHQIPWRHQRLHGFLTPEDGRTMEQTAARLVAGGRTPPTLKHAPHPPPQ